MSIPVVLLLLLLVIYSITLPKIFVKAGEESWKGYIPVFNLFVLIKLLKRPFWWIFLLFVPGVNLIMFTILHVETAIAFDKRNAGEQWFAGVLPWVFLPMLAFSEPDAKWVGSRDWEGKKKSFMREWGEAIIFAIVAASIIRTFFLEAFTIPTPSMEGSMLVGDYLFVSKMSYGPRVPETPLSIPFVHNIIPGSMMNSYSEIIKLPNFRLPGFGDVDRYDAVVFNFPHGDTVLIDPEYVSHDYYGFLRDEAIAIAGGYKNYSTNPTKFKTKARINFEEKKYCKSCSHHKIGGVKRRPVDKEDNYVKRCVGLPGETLEIRDKQVFINGEAIPNPDKLQYLHFIKFIEGKEHQGMKKMQKAFRLLRSEIQTYQGNRTLPLSAGQYETLKSWSLVDTSFVLSFPKDVNHNRERLFPNYNSDLYSGWTVDNYGPVHLPAKGETVELTLENLPTYQRAIEVYEHNELQVKDGQIFINGEAANSYIFQQGYYWMMGDNRHNSADSRFWGFVPEDHVVGKALFTWFSKEDNYNHGDNRIRWKRMFKTVERPE